MVEFDPYAPPITDIPGAGHGSGEPLFTDQHVVLATFFGTPIAGFIVLGLNEGRMGRTNQLGKALGLGVLATVVVIGIALALPPQMPGYLLSIAYLFGMRHLARQWQGDEVMHRLSTGTAKASGWVAFGIGAACLLGLGAVGFAVGFWFPEWIPG